jgi:hypothetical protein
LISAFILPGVSTAFTWTATKESNKFTGQIYILSTETYEIRAEHEWWCDTATIEGTLNVAPWISVSNNGGNIIIHANHILIGPDAKIIADGAGCEGGIGGFGGPIAGGNVGGTGYGGDGAAGWPGSLGTNGGAGSGEYRGSGGDKGTEGGAGGAIGAWGEADGHGGGGGKVGGTGEDGKNGRYFSPARISGNEEVMTGEEWLLMGSGGGGGGGGRSGGGGGGGGAGYFTSGERKFNAPGGRGGDSGAGGPGIYGGYGGGYVKLYAVKSFIFKGKISTKGMPSAQPYPETTASTGKAGTPGTETSRDGNPGAGGAAGGPLPQPSLDGSDGGSCTPIDKWAGGGGGGGGAGGKGGAGGGGAGGGVLLYCNKYNGFSIGDYAIIDARGADHTQPDATWNGGTVKVFYSAATEPSIRTNYYGQYFPIPIQAWDSPTIPSGPIPASGEAGVLLNSILSWECSSPAGNSLSYDVYFGTSSNPPKGLTTGEKHIRLNSLGTIQQYQTYYWKIIARDTISGAETPGPLWSFTTIPPTGTINVRTSIKGSGSPILASFSINGTSVYGDSTFTGTTDAGGTWTQPLVPIGEYTITYFVTPEYLTPPPSTESLSNDGGVITFEGYYILDETTSPNPFDVFFQKNEPPGKVTFTWEAKGDPEPSSGMAGYKVFVEKDSAPFKSYPEQSDYYAGTKAEIDIPDGSNYSAYVVAYDNAGNTTREPASNLSIGMINFDPPAIWVETMDLNSKRIQVENGQTIYVPAACDFDLSASDGNCIQSLSISITGKDVDLSRTEPGAGESAEFSYRVSETPAAKLSEGTYTLTVTASDGALSNNITASLVVSSGVKVIGKPKSFPNPFKPGIDAVKIQYTLASPTDVKISIYNSAGKVAKTFTCKAGVDQGGLGGVNLVPWDGKDNFGNYVANGPYFYYIIADGKVIGKGELAAFK